MLWAFSLSLSLSLFFFFFLRSQCHTHNQFWPELNMHWMDPWRHTAIYKSQPQTEKSSIHKHKSQLISTSSCGTSWDRSWAHLSNRYTWHRNENERRWRCNNWWCRRWEQRVDRRCSRWGIFCFYVFGFF